MAFVGIVVSVPVVAVRLFMQVFLKVPAAGKVDLCVSAVCGRDKCVNIRIYK